ncbi:hypothetical protein SAMN05216569_1169 [Pseudoxanthomonas sp. CF125]|nr:hypothetical protein SAMN05216569_1169 [Pseudoxanthomonas sp. CF125]
METEATGDPHDCSSGELLSRLLAADDIDGAIDAELMSFAPCPACDPIVVARVAAEQKRLATAWAARDRYLARKARLARRAEEREARRASSLPERKSALPAAAAAILARAKAKAAERTKR